MYICICESCYSSRLAVVVPSIISSIALRAVLNDPKFFFKVQNFENFVNREEAFFQTTSKTLEATEGP